MAGHQSLELRMEVRYLPPEQTIVAPRACEALDRLVMSDRRLSAVVLAAGEGTRMRSARPKPLHLLCGRAMLLYVLDALADCSVSRVVVVVGHGAERVTKKLQDEEPDLRLDFVEQRVQRGTGDAVAVGLTGSPTTPTSTSTTT